MEAITRILDFWFESEDLWFKKDDAFDETIRQRFSADHERAAAGGLAVVLAGCQRLPADSGPITEGRPALTQQRAALEEDPYWDFWEEPGDPSSWMEERAGDSEGFEEPEPSEDPYGGGWESFEQADPSSGDGEESTSSGDPAGDSTLGQKPVVDPCAGAEAHLAVEEDRRALISAARSSACSIDPEGSDCSGLTQLEQASDNVVDWARVRRDACLARISH